MMSFRNLPSDKEGLGHQGCSLERKDGYLPDADHVTATFRRWAHCSYLAYPVAGESLGSVLLARAVTWVSEASYAMHVHKVGLSLLMPSVAEFRSACP